MLTGKIFILFLSHSLDIKRTLRWFRSKWKTFWRRLVSDKRSFWKKTFRFCQWKNRGSSYIYFIWDI